MKQLRVKIAFKIITNTSSNLAKCVGIWTNSKYSHVELILDDTWYTSVEDIGVVKNDRLITDSWAVVDLGVITITKEQHLKLQDWLNRQLGKEYDWKGIFFTQVLPFRFESRNKWFCSELVTKILQMLMVYETMDMVPYCVSPAKLAKTFKIE